MSIYLPQLPAPVEYSSNNGGDALNVARLREFCNQTNSNFSTVCSEVNTVWTTLSEQRNINIKILQFMNWLAVTNPHILDEFQATANAYEKLAPRTEASSDGPYTSI